MKHFTLSPSGFLLAVMLCASAVETTYAQLPPRMVGYRDYGFYDNQFNPSDSTFWRYDQPNAFNQRTQQWQPSVMSTRFADENGQPTIPDDSTIYAYDNNGNNTVIIEMSFDNVNWDTTDQTYMTYNSNNLITKEITLRNTRTTPKWDKYEKSYTYDGQNNLIEYILEDIDDVTGARSNSSRAVYAYSGNQKISETLYDWDNSQWEPNFRTRYHYTGGKRDSVWKETYDNSISDFQPYDLQAGHYNANNDIDTLMFYIANINGWSAEARYVYIYSGNRNVVQRIAQGIFSGGWENVSSDSTYYNADNLPSWKVFSQQWNYTAGKFENRNYETYKYIYYYEQPTGISDKAKPHSGMIVYPNPASDYLTIRLENPTANPFTVTICDATGQTVRHWNEPSTARFTRTIDVSDLPTGQYILRTNADKLNYQRFTILRSR